MEIKDKLRYERLERISYSRRPSRVRVKDARKQRSTKHNNISLDKHHELRYGKLRVSAHLGFANYLRETSTALSSVATNEKRENKGKE